MYQLKRDQVISIWFPFFQRIQPNLGIALGAS